jgi:hypothetical protein
MLWKSTSDELLTAAAPLADDWRDWLSRDVDGFGLPLVGALLGMQPAAESESNLPADLDTFRKG